MPLARKRSNDHLSDNGHESGELSDELELKRLRSAGNGTARGATDDGETARGATDDGEGADLGIRTRWDAPSDELEPAQPTASRWHVDDDESGDIAEEAAMPKSSRWHAEDEDDADEKPESDGTGLRSLGTSAAGDGENGAQPRQIDIGTTPESLREPDRRDMLLECRTNADFQFLKQVGAGTFGEVQKATDKLTGQVVALKRVKLPPSFKTEGFPMTSIREINVLLTMSHPNIVNVSEVVVSSKSDDVYMVMEYVQLDLKKFMDKYKSRLKISEIKCIVHQLLRGMQYLHDNWVLHRDLKPANILYDHMGNIKICDFGLARHFGDPVPHMTPLVVTRCYRGPEIALGVTNYGPPLDVWSIGVIAAELITNKAPFIESKSDNDLVNAIARVIGSPHEVWPGVASTPKYKKLDVLKNEPSRLADKLGVRMGSGMAVALNLDYNLTEAGLDLMERMLRWNPEERISTAEALAHPWFEEMPHVCRPCFMPQLPPEELRRS